ncbi:MAG: hypothetical protein ACKO38_21615 [Planctomycetota bacterium]
MNYAPYLSYRDQWIRVPVTYYRPVSVVDPTTGAVTSAMQPCTATAWQVQRVPVAGRSLFTRYQPAPVVGGTRLAAPAVVMPGAAPVQPGACGNALCQPAQAYSGWTIPTAPSIVAAPVAPAPQTIVMPSPPSGAVPSVAPPTGSAPRAIMDTRPSLQPGEGANSANYPPLVPVPNTDPSSASDNGNTNANGTSEFREDANDASQTDTDANGSGGEDAGGGGPPLSSPNAAFDPAPRNNASTSSPSSRPSSSPSSMSSPAGKRQSPTRVMPVPDPDASPFRVPQQTTPRLIVPRDRVAAPAAPQRPSPGTLAAARSVSGSPVTTSQPVRRVVPNATAPRSDRWDDSGWRSVAPSPTQSTAAATPPARK